MFFSVFLYGEASRSRKRHHAFSRLRHFSSCACPSLLRRMGCLHTRWHDILCFYSGRQHATSKIPKGFLRFPLRTSGNPVTFKDLLDEKTEKSIRKRLRFRMFFSVFLYGQSMLSIVCLAIEETPSCVFEIAAFFILRLPVSATPIRNLFQYPAMLSFSSAQLLKSHVIFPSDLFCIFFASAVFLVYICQTTLH